MLATSFTTFLWSLIVIFFMVVYFMMLFSVIVDIFRRHDASGGKKALWLIFILFVPLLGLLAYLIVNGNGIAERQSKDVQKSQDRVRPVRPERRRRVRRPDRQGEGAPRRRHDHAGRVRPDQGEGARLAARRALRARRSDGGNSRFPPLAPLSQTFVSRTSVTARIDQAAGRSGTASSPCSARRQPASTPCTAAAPTIAPSGAGSSAG